MPDGTKIGVYDANGTENDQVSSTYEGRHLTFLESDITGHEHTWVTKGHPVVVGEHIVGVVLAIVRVDGTFGAAATAAGDLISIDSEGIFDLSVVATDEDGDNAVVAGDELYIHRTTGIISKNYNKATHAHFGYALGSVSSSNTAIIAVKGHWDPDDENELVGQSDALSVNADAGHRFREYHYEAQGGGYIHGDHLELTITTLSCPSAQALVRKLLWTNDVNRITGYAAVGEFELVVTGGNATIDTMCVMRLTSSIGTLTGSGVTNVITAWIYIQEYATVQNEQLEHLFAIYDTDSDYPYTTSNAALFTTLSGDIAANFALKFVVNDVDYWILCRNAIT